jgi:hypothetical protein
MPRPVAPPAEAAPRLLRNEEELAALPASQRIRYRLVSAGRRRGAPQVTGAGTGLLAAPLARRGHPVLAVEPARAMLAVCVEAVPPMSRRCWPRRGDGAGESRPVWSSPPTRSTGSAPTPAVPRRRLLAADGGAAVVVPEPLDTAFMRGVQALLTAANPKARSLPGGPRARELLVLAAGPGRPVEEVWEQRVRLEAAALRSVVRSLSYGAPALGAAATERLLSAVDALGARKGRVGKRCCGCGSGAGGVTPDRRRPPRR